MIVHDYSIDGEDYREFCHLLEESPLGDRPVQEAAMLLTAVAFSLVGGDAIVELIGILDADGWPRPGRPEHFIKAVPRERFSEN